MLNMKCHVGENNYVYNDYYEQKVYKAKKQHQCGECQSLIKKGQKYCKISATFERAWWHHKVCYPCYCIMVDLECEFDAGAMYHTLENSIGLDKAKMF